MTYARRTARVLLLDNADRVLLINSHFHKDDPPGRQFWLTPGGGVDDGESLPVAAARELREEIGLITEPSSLTGPVAYSSGFASLSWITGILRDDFFLHRVDSHDVDTAGMEALESGTYVGYRWWPVEVLASTSETVYPLGLAALLTDILKAGPPDSPVELPWHL